MIIDVFFQGALLLGLTAGLIYWAAYSWQDGEGWLRSLVKTTTLAPLALFWVVSGSQGQSAVWPMALGLALGVIGDFFLSRPGQKAFLAGMAAFGLGHLAYSGGMAVRSAELGFVPLGPSDVLMICAVLALVLSTEFWLRPRTGALLWPVRVYVALIALMALAAILLPDHPGRSALQLGAALFLVSDLLLAIRLFVVKGPFVRATLGALLWPAYVLGQLLIFMGAGQFWPPA